MRSGGSSSSRWRGGARPRVESTRRAVSDSSLAPDVSGWAGVADVTVLLSHDILLFDETCPRGPGVRRRRACSVASGSEARSARAPLPGRTGRRRRLRSTAVLPGSRARSSSESCAFHFRQGGAARSRSGASRSPSCRRSAPCGASTAAGRSPGSIRGRHGSRPAFRQGRPRPTTCGPEPARSGRSTTAPAMSSASIRWRAR